MKLKYESTPGDALTETHFLFMVNLYNLMVAGWPGVELKMQDFQSHEKVGV